MLRRKTVSQLLTTYLLYKWKCHWTIKSDIFPLGPAFCWYRYITCSYCWLTNTSNPSGLTNIYYYVPWVRRGVDLHISSGLPRLHCGHLVHVYIWLGWRLQSRLAWPEVAIRGTSAPCGFHPLLTWRPAWVSFNESGRSIKR